MRLSRRWMIWEEWMDDLDIVLCFRDPALLISILDSELSLVTDQVASRPTKFLYLNISPENGNNSNTCLSLVLAPYRDPERKMPSPNTNNERALSPLLLGREIIRHFVRSRPSSVTRLYQQGVFKPCRSPVNGRLGMRDPACGCGMLSKLESLE